MDNWEGFTAALASRTAYYDEYVIEISDSFFFGESEIEDCPIVDGESQGFCNKNSKFALINAQLTFQGKKVHANICELPIYKQWSVGSFQLRAIYNRNKFMYFNPTTRENRKQAAFSFND